MLQVFLMKSEIQIMLGNSQYRYLLGLKHQLPVVKAKQSQTQHEKIRLQQILEMKEQLLARASTQIKQLSRYCVQMCKKVNEANEKEQNQNQEFMKKQQQLLYELMIFEQKCEEQKAQLQLEREKGKRKELECENLMLQIDQLKGQILKKNQQICQKRVLHKRIQDKLQSLQQEQTSLKQQINTLQQLNKDLKIDKALIIRQSHSYEQKIKQQSLLIQKQLQQLNGGYAKEQKLKLLIKKLQKNVNFLKIKQNQQKEERLILIKNESKAILQKQQIFKLKIKKLQDQGNILKEKSTKKEEQNIILRQKNGELILNKKYLNQSLKQIQLQISLYKDQLFKVKLLINNWFKTFLSQQQSMSLSIQQQICQVQNKFINSLNKARLEHNQLITKNAQLQQRHINANTNAEKRQTEDINKQVGQFNQHKDDNLMICSRKVNAEYVWSIVLQYIVQINQKLHLQIHDHADERRILSLQFKQLMKKIKQNFSSWSKNSRLKRP